MATNLAIDNKLLGRANRVGLLAAMFAGFVLSWQISLAEPPTALRYETLYLSAAFRASALQQYAKRPRGCFVNPGAAERPL